MLEIGILLLAGAVLATFAARAFYLRPSPARWATWDTPGNLIVVAITAMAGFGLAARGMGIAGLFFGTQSPLDAMLALLLLALAVGGIVIWHRQRPGTIGTR